MQTSAVTHDNTLHPFADHAQKEMVFQNTHITLFKYTPQTVKCDTPVCISYALVNKTYVLDLSPKNSFIRSLLKEGLIVYLIVWHDPAKTMCNVTLEDYVCRNLNICVDKVRQLHDIPQINLLGICQGGTFSLMYTSLFGEKIKNLILMVTPVDFHSSENLFTHMAKTWDTKKIAGGFPLLTGDFMNMGFLQLKPCELLINKYVGAVQFLNDEHKREFFLRMEKWIFDSPAQAGNTWSEFIEKCYQKNALVNDTFVLGGNKVSLSNIKCPVLNLTAAKDHLVPNECSTPLKNVISSTDYTYESFSTGHIGILVGRIVAKKVAPTIGEWLQKRD
ncbi:class III poly(R)-hydroxyalkanoic acid synthase subunit PhaC [Candidatus Uabimicrobium amorphum]|uniref:Poly(3-hydroxyalkanoate) polymerase subunit PhaC n=1 Tax=Uabimicrobium amorphum TaxID=2596890 RepID=A0A5S9IQ63_UABAM|nr:class III poly(R)-hydroxyalkanoic acid synthase subunit PhaC [Candidatus Uabimicrobium amorphum]BBM85421.1 poly-beta-hydroxybutyrate polymerase [Candidatus Uabimicrobium amorphum]